MGVHSRERNHTHKLSGLSHLQTSSITSGYCPNRPNTYDYFHFRVIKKLSNFSYLKNTFSFNGNLFPISILPIVCFLITDTEFGFINTLNHKRKSILYLRKLSFYRRILIKLLGLDASFYKIIDVEFELFNGFFRQRSRFQHLHLVLYVVFRASNPEFRQHRELISSPSSIVIL